MLCLLFVGLVAIVSASTEVASTDVLDISNVVFANSSDALSSCTGEYPDITELSDVTSTSVTIKWESIQDESNITGYQVIFWNYSTTVYSSENVPLDDDRSSTELHALTIDTLEPFTQYFLSVRAVCQGTTVSYGVAAFKVETITQSTSPSGRVSGVSVSVNVSNLSVMISWDELQSDKWNGVMEYYVVVVADVTPGSGFQLRQLVPVKETSLIIYNVKTDHSYIVTVSALSSGGLGMASEPYYVKIENPTVATPEGNEGQKISDIWYYLAVPAGVILAVCGTVIVIMCKINYDRKKRKYMYARDITTNIDEQKFMVGSDFDRAQRLDPTRMSNRPLPAHPPESPHPRTPSVSSMSARLIDQTSPNQFMHGGAGGMGMSFSSADHQSHFHPQFQSQPSHPHHIPQPYPAHHPPPGGPPDLLPPLDLDPAAVHHQYRNPSVSSPQIPQLSQPLSDLSSATPSSVFTESNVPQMDDNLSSPNTPKAYEVPSDSKTCHQSGGSPVMTSHHTLPNPRRPHTATGVMASQPMLSRHPQTSHSPVSFTHSSSDIRTNTVRQPPDVPPHKANSFAHQQRPTIQQSARPESGLYSEVPNDTGESSTVGDYPKITPPADSTLGMSTVLPPMISDGSVISSDQYSDYSDIPGACGSTPPPPPPPTEGRQKLPSLEEEYTNSNRLSSESMSSFSTDSRSSSPAHSKISDIQFNKMATTPSSTGRPGIVAPPTAGHVTIPEEHDYDECNSVITDNSSSITKPNPYLSPVDIVAPSNGQHSPSD